MDCKWKDCEDKNIEDLFSHLKAHLRDQSDIRCMWEGCPKYNEPNTSKGAVYSHCKSHCGDKNWTCQICNIEFNSMSVYYRHKKKHVIFEKKEETCIMKISLLGDLLEYHKQKTKNLVKKLEDKKTNLKFLNNEICEIIRKYVKGNNCYTGMRTWKDY